MTLTEHLLSAFPQSYARATRHTFLRAAGERTLSVHTLSSWLTQDLFYNDAYIKLLGLLLSRLEQAPVQLQRRTLRFLTGALVNIERERGFFEDVAKRHGLNLEQRPSQSAEEEARSGGTTAVRSDLITPDTKSYVDFMVATAALGTYEEGLVLLWATERCYLDAWTYASQQQKATGPDSPAGPLDELIANWTSAEFREFVDDLARLVDDLQVPVGSGDPRIDAIEGVMRRVLWLEERFWPTIAP